MLQLCGEGFFDFAADTQPNRLASLRMITLTSVHLPITLRFIANFEQTVFRVVALATIRTYQVSRPTCTLAVVIPGYSERLAATAGYEEHSYLRLGLRIAS